MIGAIYKNSDNNVIAFTRLSEKNGISYCKTD